MVERFRAGLERARMNGTRSGRPLGVRASCSGAMKRLTCVLKGRAGGRSQNDWA